MLPHDTAHPFPGDDDPAVQAYRLRSVESGVKSILREMGEINRKLDKQPAPCPRPGACVGIDERLQGVEATVSTIKELEAERKGAWKATGLMGGLIGSGLTLAIHYFTKKP
jgi:hypothetical protein